jgi:hypothetical protein
MPNTLNLQAPTLGQAVALFKVEFRKRYPQSRFLLDGDGYEDEDLDLNIYVDGETLELERYAIEVSHIVQQATGYFILPFILSAPEHPTGA